MLVRRERETAMHNTAIWRHGSWYNRFLAITRSPYIELPDRRATFLGINYLQLARFAYAIVVIND